MSERSALGDGQAEACPYQSKRHVLPWHKPPELSAGNLAELARRGNSVHALDQFTLRDWMAADV